MMVVALHSIPLSAALLSRYRPISGGRLTNRGFALKIAERLNGSHFVNREKLKQEKVINSVMPPPKKPAAPKGRRGLAPRRFNVLSAALASAISIEELTLRMDVIHMESAARSTIFVDVVSGLIAEKIHAAVARHWLSTIASRDYVYALEKKAFDTMVFQHRSKLGILRASVSPEVVAKKIRDAMEEETLTRKKVVLLEEKMFHDFFKQLGRILLEVNPSILYGDWQETVDESDLLGDDGSQTAGEKGATTRRLQRPGTFLRMAAMAAAEDMDSDVPTAMRAAVKQQRRAVKLGADGRPLVHLCDGCPFVNPEDCPFYAREWVSKEAFLEAHVGRRLPRLKAPIRLEQLSYDKMLQEREQQIAQMNLRLFNSRLIN